MRYPNPRRLRNWIVGLLVAALAAAITNALTGIISSTGTVLRQKVTGQQPVVVSTWTGFKEFRTEKVHFIGGGRTWLFLRDVQSLTYPKDADDLDEWEKWGAQYGGIPGPGSTLVDVVIQGRSASPVVLLDLQVRVLERRPPPRGTTIHVGGGGPIGARYFTAELDAEPPRLRYDTEMDGDEGRPIEFPYKVSDTDPEVFTIEGSSNNYDVTWVAELHWSFEGKNGLTVIDDGGKPFRTVSSKNAPLYIASNGQFRRV